MAQAFICRLVATEAGLDPRPVHCGICFGQSGAGTGFSTSTFFFFYLLLSFRQYYVSVYSFFTVGN